MATRTATAKHTKAKKAPAKVKAKTALKVKAAPKAAKKKAPVKKVFATHKRLAGTKYTVAFNDAYGELKRVYATPPTGLNDNVIEGKSIGDLEGNYHTISGWLQTKANYPNFSLRTLQNSRHH